MSLGLSVFLIFMSTNIAGHGLPMAARNVPFQSSFIKNVRFQDPKLGLENLKLPLSMMAAAPQLNFAKSESGKNLCSSTVVSDNGNVLTAAHCLEVCAREAGLLKEESGYWSVDTRRIDRMTCSVRVNGVRAEFKVLAMAPCIPTGTAYYSPEYPTRCKALDYAVLAPVIDRSSHAPCLRMSDQRAAVGEDVISIGYPKQSIRSMYKKGARDTSGDSVELTVGEVLAPQGKCFVDVDEKNRGQPLVNRGDKKFQNKQRTAAILEEVRQGRLIQTSTDVLRGMSGASLVNKDGEIKGVAVANEGNGDMFFCSGSGFYGSTTGMIQDIKESFPNLSLSKLFKCEKRAVFPKVNKPDPHMSPANQEAESVEGVQ